MELNNEFTVPVPVDQAWQVLTDVERIAPCMPGAALEEVEGDEYRGVVKVKVGPVTAQYRGKASFLERDAATHRAVLRAEGRETRGQGNASATITAHLEPVGEGTRVTVTTDLAITGRVAQMGRGVLADVSSKLLGQFVQSLESTVLGGSGGSPSSDSVAAGDAALAAAAQAPTDAVEAPARRKRAAKKAPAKAAPDGPGEPAEEASETSTPPESAWVEQEREPDAVEPSHHATQGNGSEPGVRRIVPDREVAPVDLLDLAGPSLAVRVIVPVAILVVVLALLRRRRRRQS